MQLYISGEAKRLRIVERRNYVYPVNHGVMIKINLYNSSAQFLK